MHLLVYNKKRQLLNAPRVQGDHRGRGTLADTVPSAPGGCSMCPDANSTRRSSRANENACAKNLHTPLKRQAYK